MKKPLLLKPRIRTTFLLLALIKFAVAENSPDSLSGFDGWATHSREQKIAWLGKAMNAPDLPIEYLRTIADDIGLMTRAKSQLDEQFNVDLSANSTPKELAIFEREIALSLSDVRLGRRLYPMGVARIKETFPCVEVMRKNGPRAAVVLVQYLFDHRDLEAQQVELYFQSLFGAVPKSVAINWLRIYGENISTADNRVERLAFLSSIAARIEYAP